MYRCVCWRCCWRWVGSGGAGIVVVRRSLLRNADTVAGTGFGKHRPGKSDQQQTHSAILESTALYVVEIMQSGKGAGGISWSSTVRCGSGSG